MKKSPLQGLLTALAYLSGALGGVLLGITIVRCLDAENLSDMSFGGFMLTYLGYIAVAALAYFCGIIIHEAGHLVFGLRTGYTFVSFRVGSLTWVKQNGKIVRKRFKLAGTGGQCLLGPPDLVDGRMPVVLYNLGGVLFNLITAAVFYPLYRLLRGVPVLNAFLGGLWVMGIVMALQNGIPAKLRQLPNDGYNIVSLLRDPAAVRAFWVQMKVNEQGTMGMRLGDMPEAWFELPDGADLTNPLNASVAVSAESRLTDRHDFEAAYRAAGALLAEKASLPGIYVNFITLDSVFCDLMLRGAEADTSPLQAKSLVQFSKAMRQNPTVIRTQYAAERIKERDEKAAAKLREEFGRVAESYPIPADIAMERELMALVDERVNG